MKFRHWSNARVWSVIALVLAVLMPFAILEIVRDRRRINRESSAEIRFGMTKSEVEAILNGPPDALPGTHSDSGGSLTLPNRTFEEVFRFKTSDGGGRVRGQFNGSGTGKSPFDTVRNDCFAWRNGNHEIYVYFNAEMKMQGKMIRTWPREPMWQRFCRWLRLG